MLLAMDQTAANFPFTWDAYRSDERQNRTVGGKRVVAAPIDHPASTDQTPRLSEDGPVALGTSGQDGSDLEAGALSCPTGDTPSLAP